MCDSISQIIVTILSVNARFFLFFYFPQEAEYLHYYKLATKNPSG